MRKIAVLSFLVVLSLVLSACRGDGEPSASGTAVRSAVITLVENDVRARPNEQAAFEPAVVGQEIAVGAQVQSGENGRGRLELRPENTLVYLGPNTLFTLTALEQPAGDPFARLWLELGRVWIVLRGGSLEVETPSGVASVRGSYMGVGYGPNGLNMTCLEGHCNLTYDGQSWDMTGGQACDILPDGGVNQRLMTPQEYDEWNENVPEAGDLPPVETPTATPTPLPSPTPSPTPQATQQPSSFGPDLDDFPPGYSPLTGLPVEDPYLLQLPAVLISITHFPPSARPQAGPGFAPIVYEIYISEGTTRFLVVFYGEEPERQPQYRGNCSVNETPFVPGETVLANYVWFDEDRDGVQDSWEYGIEGVCVNLYDEQGGLLQTTSTDIHGFYGFNVQAGGRYILEFEPLPGLMFTDPHVGYDDADSDANPATGRTPLISAVGIDMTWDAGYIPRPPDETETPTPTSDETPDETPAQPGEEVTGGGEVVGPVRSGRLPYRYIRDYFPGSCLVYAGASQEVLSQLPGCRLQYGSDESDINSAMLDITAMRQLAENNRDPNVPIDYSGNAFSETPPPGGAAAGRIDVFWSWQNQARWVYNPLAGAYERSVNHPDRPDEFAPIADRLTGRTLLFENVIFVFAEHIVQSPTIIDINLQTGQQGYAYIFRNGQMYRARWNTLAGDYEQTTGRARPMKFTDEYGNPFPLAPGHTWVHVFTPASYVQEQSPGVWLARFYAPAGSR
ncbi:MAG: SdrD B-like domain-containing protein [Anaerolineales bacterium]